MHGSCKQGQRLHMKYSRSSTEKERFNKSTHASHGTCHAENPTDPNNHAILTCVAGTWPVHKVHLVHAIHLAHPCKSLIHINTKAGGIKACEHLPDAQGFGSIFASEQCPLPSPRTFNSHLWKLRTVGRCAMESSMMLRSTAAW